MKTVAFVKKTLFDLVKQVVFCRLAPLATERRRNKSNSQISWSWLQVGTTGSITGPLGTRNRTRNGTRNRTHWDLAVAGFCGFCIATFHQD